MKHRYENFGGIIASEEPPFLAFVDRQYMRDLGLDESEQWQTDDNNIGILSAPTEVHFAITNKCSVGCAHCYMDAGKADEGELDTQGMKDALDVLAKLNVFHIAMGGGEALERDDLFEVAAYAKKIGLVPNLTISGLGVNKEIAQKLKLFGQINLSLDGIGEKYNTYRGKNMFAEVDKAIDLLVEAGIHTGINCVVGNGNFNDLENIFKYANSKKINEIEFLRYKPSGRGKEHYTLNKTTHEQNKKLAPLLSKYSKKYKIIAKIDCSFVPMFCYNKPSPKLLNAIAAYGCEAGNVLLGIRSNGIVSGCSFLEGSSTNVFDLPHIYKNDRKKLAQFFDWIKDAPEPCKSCKYLKICKGGCHGVSYFLKDDYNEPDPDCPFVVEYNTKSAK